MPEAMPAANFGEIPLPRTPANKWEIIGEDTLAFRNLASSIAQIHPKFIAAF
jgi:hypothetical protein